MGKTCRNYIGGKWVASASKVVNKLTNPATGGSLGEVAMSTADEVQSAIAAAHKAFPEWRRVPPLSRARYLLRLRDKLEEEFDDFAAVVTLEHGKVIDESRGEVRRAIEMLEVAAGIPCLMQGYNSEDIAPGIDEYAIWQPLGVFACLAPFNFPAMVPFWFFPFAIATGNTYVVKPSPIVPLTMQKAFEIMEDIDLPPGVLNLVNGGPDAANVLMASRDVVGISFVGSSKIARIVYKTAAAAGQRVQAQGGAKNFLTVMPDANLDKAIPNIMTSVYGCTGQRCLSGSVVLAVGDIYDELKRRLVESASRLKVGNGMDETVEMGPLTTADKKQSVAELDRRRRGRRREAAPGRPETEGRQPARYLLPRPIHFRPGDAGHEDRAGGDLRPGRRHCAHEESGRGDGHGERQPLRQRLHHLHEFRRRGAGVPLRRELRQHRRQRRHRRADGVLPLRRAQGVVFRRSPRPGKGRHPVLHRPEDRHREVAVGWSSTSSA